MKTKIIQSRPVFHVLAVKPRQFSPFKELALLGYYRPVSFLFYALLFFLCVSLHIFPSRYLDSPFTFTPPIHFSGAFSCYSCSPFPHSSPLTWRSLSSPPLYSSVPSPRLGTDDSAAVLLSYPLRSPRRPHSSISASALSSTFPFLRSTSLTRFSMFHSPFPRTRYSPHHGHFAREGLHLLLWLSTTATTNAQCTYCRRGRREISCVLKDISGMFCASTGQMIYPEKTSFHERKARSVSTELYRGMLYPFLTNWKNARLFSVTFILYPIRDGQLASYCKQPTTMPRAITYGFLPRSSSSFSCPLRSSQRCPSSQSHCFPYTSSCSASPQSSPTLLESSSPSYLSNHHWQVDEQISSDQRRAVEAALAGLQSKMESVAAADSVAADVASISSVKEEVTLTYVRVPARDTQRLAKQLRKYLFRRPQFRPIQSEVDDSSPVHPVVSSTYVYGLTDQGKDNPLCGETPSAATSSPANSATPTSPAPAATAVHLLSTSASAVASSTPSLPSETFAEASHSTGGNGTSITSTTNKEDDAECIKTVVHNEGVEAVATPTERAGKAPGAAAAELTTGPSFAVENVKQCWRRIFLEENIKEDLQGLPDDLRSSLLSQADASVGRQNVQLSYANMTAEEVLRKSLPANVEVPRRFEVVGHIAHLNLKTEQLPYRFLIARVLLDKVPALRTVVCKTGIASQWRELQFEHLAGERSYVARLKENDMLFEIDYAKVYWNSRLAAEREKLVQAIPPGSIVLDVFAGVGAFSVFLAKRGCLVSANDGNPAAVVCMKKNIELNKLQKSHITTFNLDARDFIREAVGSPEKLLQLLQCHAKMQRQRGTATGAEKAAVAEALVLPRPSEIAKSARKTESASASQHTAEAIAAARVSTAASEGTERSAEYEAGSKRLRVDGQDSSTSNADVVAQDRETGENNRRMCAREVQCDGTGTGSQRSAIDSRGSRSDDTTNRLQVVLHTESSKETTAQKTSSRSATPKSGATVENNTSRYTRENICISADGTPSPEEGNDGSREGKCYEEGPGEGGKKGVFETCPSDLPPEIHYIMNLPELALDFLDVFRGLLATPRSTTAIGRSEQNPGKTLDALKKVKHRVHCYGFSRSVPPEIEFKPRVEQALQHAWPEDAEVREVRDVAPNKRMYHVGFTVPEAVLYHCSDCRKQ